MIGEDRIVCSKRFTYSNNCELDNVGRFISAMVVQVKVEDLNKKEWIMAGENFCYYALCYPPLKRFGRPEDLMVLQTSTA